MIRLVAIDLDGTLYNSQHQLTPAVRRAVWRVNDAGIQPVVVTGRGRQGAEMALEDLGLDLPYICAAGALVRPGRLGTAIAEYTFHVPQELPLVFELVQRHQLGVIGDSPLGVFWYGPDELGNALRPQNKAYLYHRQRSTHLEKDFDRPMFKITLAGEPDILRQVEAEILAHCPSIFPVLGGANFLDLTALGVNKGAALQRLAAYFSIPLLQVAAIGDQLIDLPMFQVAGLSFAMGNAAPAVQAGAHQLAPSNDLDGVAWALEQLE